jgi:hypothetical protein
MNPMQSPNAGPGGKGFGVREEKHVQCTLDTDNDWTPISKARELLAPTSDECKDCQACRP